MPFRSLFDEHAPALYEKLGLTEEQRKAREEAFLDAVTDAGLRDDDAATLYRLNVSEQLATAAGHKPEAAAVAEMAEDVRRTVREHYGPDTDDLVARVRAYLARTPALAALFNVRTLSVRPDLNLMLLADVRRHGL